MPSIKEMQNADLSGYASIERPQIAVDNPTNTMRSAFMRCPLPPFNSDPDTLRQFEGGMVPKFRVMPLPVSSVTGTSGAAGTSSVTVINTSSTSTSTGGTTVTTNLKAVTSNIVTPILSPGEGYQASISMAKSFQLLSLTANALSEIRLYGSGITQAFDASRPEGNPVAAETMSNIISCITFDTAPFIWPWQNKVGANQDNPQTKLVYITVFNLDPVNNSTISVTVSYVPLET